MDGTEELRTEAASIAQAILDVAGGGTEEPGKARTMPDELRERFITFRTLLYVRGLHDPVLARFDSATVAQADSKRIAQALEILAEKL